MKTKMIPMKFLVDVKLVRTGEFLIQSDEYSCDVPETHAESEVLVKEYALHQYRNGFRLLMAYQPSFREKMKAVRSLVDVNIELVRI
jgi:hypothetical protein